MSQSEPSAATVRDLVEMNFRAHSECCGDVMHAVAAAAYEIVDRAVGANRTSLVWNSKGEANQRHVQSALWRALYSAREQELLTVAQVAGGIVTLERKRGGQA